MPARRRKSASQKMTAEAAPTEAPPSEEEPRASVQQVVEVVEEEESVPPVEEQVTPEPSPEPEPEESPTRKAMVEELYTTTEPKSAVMPEISMHRNNSKKPLIVWAIVTIIVAAITGGVLFTLSRGGQSPTLFVRPTPTPTPAPEPTATPTPQALDKESFEVQILNGGGTPGAAGKLKSFLEDKGYTIADTGNTEEYTYETTEIHTTASMSGAISTLTADLKDSYVLGTSASDLPDDAEFPVQVIVGKE